MSEIYEPAEDSYLMSDILSKELSKLLKKNPILKFLEMGCGSGINLATAKSVGVKNITGVDINKKAVEQCKKLGFDCMASDLFENVKGKFDVIAFNPPYLPLDSKESKSSKVATTGGKKGNEVIIRFLKQAKKHLAEKGKIFVITSSLSQRVDFERLSYESEMLKKQKLFFEEIYVWKLSR